LDGAGAADLGPFLEHKRGAIKVGREEEISEHTCEVDQRCDVRGRSCDLLRCLLEDVVYDSPRSRRSPFTRFLDCETTTFSDVYLALTSSLPQCRTPDRHLKGVGEKTSVSGVQ
jgi:hypothetical protein